MQPSKERDADEEDDPLEAVEDLLDNDLAGDDRGTSETANTGSETAADRDSATTGDAPLVGMSGRAFSLKAFGIVLLVLGGGVFAGGLIPLIGSTIGQAGGVFVGAFLLGLAFSSRRYIETAIAGGGVGTVGALTTVLGGAFLPAGLHFLGEYALGIAGAGAVLGLLLAVLGLYFGRDLRAGLTSEIPK